MSCKENEIFVGFPKCACECKQEKIDACNEEGMAIDPETCECIDNGGGEPQDNCSTEHQEGETEYQQCGDTSNGECGTKTVTYHCNAETNYIWETEESECENIEHFQNTVDCTGEWKSGCFERKRQGVCQLNGEGTKYEWHVTGNGECKPKNSATNCGTPGWLQQLGENEVCIMLQDNLCKKYTCQGEYNIANQGIGICLKAETSDIGYIAWDRNFPPNKPIGQACYYCEQPPGGIMISKGTCQQGQGLDSCKVRQCTNSWQGNLVNCTTKSPKEYCRDMQGLPAPLAVQIDENPGKTCCGQYWDQNTRKLIKCIYQPNY